MQAVRPEHDRPVIGQGAVLPVAPERQTARRELAADLVRAPGLQIDAHEREARARAEHIVVEHGLLHALGHPVRDVGLALVRVAAQQVTVSALQRRGRSVHDGQICLSEVMLADLRRELRRSGRRAREHHQPADHAVEPVHGAHAGLRVSERLTHQLGHAARLVRGQHARRLDAHKDAVVLIENVHVVASFFSLPRVYHKCTARATASGAKAAWAVPACLGAETQPEMTGEDRASA